MSGRTNNKPVAGGNLFNLAVNVDFAGAFQDTGVPATGLTDQNSGTTVKMWFGTIKEYNALPQIRPDTYYNILEGEV